MAPPVNKIKQSKSNFGTSMQSFPEDLGQHQLIMVFRKYKFENPGTRTFNDRSSLSKRDIKSVISLPIPSNIADSYSIRLSRPELSFVTEAIATSTAAAGNSAGAGILSSVNEALRGFAPSADDLRGLKEGNTDAISSNLRYLLRSNIPSFIANGLDLGSGHTVNPKLALTFEGVDLKSHSFDWTFMVRSSNESNKLRDIQNTIKRNIHPSYSSYNQIQRAMLSYPSVVDLFFSGLDGSYFLKFKTCMVQSFSLNFTPAGLAILEGGKPAGAQMSINLIETDIHTSEDYGGESSGVNVDSGSLDMIIDEFARKEAQDKGEMFGPNLPGDN